MKRFFFLACSAFALAACNSDTKDAKPAEAGTTTAAAEKLDYPYTLDRPYQNW